MHYVGTATGGSPFNKSVCRTRKSHNGLWHSDFPGNYAYMVRSSVLAFVLIIPIEKDQVAGARLIAVVPPQSSLPEPLEADGAACEPWDDAGVQIAALVGAPGNKSRRTNPPGSRSHTRTNRADRLHCRAGREPPLRSPHHLCQCRIVVNS